MVYHNHILELVTMVQQASLPTATQPPAFDPSSRTSMERFVRRRLKLIKNILLWRRHSPNEVRELVTRIINDIVRPVVEKAWDGGGQDMVPKVSHLIERSLGAGLIQQVIEVAGQMLSQEMINSLRIGPLRRRY